MRRLFKEATRSGKPLHRVAHFLLGEGPGQLGQDFAVWASGGAMSTRLRKEILAYQLCALDDAFVEGPHARVGRIARATPRPSPAWWSTTLRLDQNLRDYEVAQAVSPGGSTCFSASGN